MKKFLSLLMALAMTLSLAACGGSKEEAPAETTDAPAETEASAEASSVPSGVEDGVLTIAMECAYAPYNWTQCDDSNGAVPISNVPGAYANGYDVQIAKYIAARLGMNLEIYSIEWDSLLPALESGAIDAIAAGMSPTAERAEQIDFTDTYYESNLVVIIRK